MVDPRGAVRFTLADYRTLPEGSRYQLEARRIEVYRLQEDASAPQRVFSAPETFEARLLPGFTLDRAALFAP